MEINSDFSDEEEDDISEINNVGGSGVTKIVTTQHSVPGWSDDEDDQSEVKSVVPQPD